MPFPDMARCITLTVATLSLVSFAASKGPIQHSRRVQGELQTGYYNHQHDTEYDNEGNDLCNAGSTPVVNGMGDVAIRCAECLTNPNTERAEDCDAACSGMQRGQEFFYPGPDGPVVTDCVTAVCSGFSANCNCCGRNLGFNYSMPAAAGPGVNAVPSQYPLTYGNTTYFKYFLGCDAAAPAAYCSTCILWRKLRQGYPNSMPCTQNEECFMTKDREHTLMASLDAFHFLLLPGSILSDWPVVGVEDPQVLEPYTEATWDVALEAALWPYSTINPLSHVPFLRFFDLPVAKTSCNIGIAINPASGRSQHQMHMHIEILPGPMRRLFQGRKKNFGTWTKVTLPLTKVSPNSRPVAYAKYFLLQDGKGKQRRPSYYQIFRQVYGFAGFSFLRMQAWGIVMIFDEAGFNLTDPHLAGTYPRGFYLIVGPRNPNGIGTWNPYRNISENVNFEPEQLLCSPASISASGFWDAATDCALYPTAFATIASVGEADAASVASIDEMEIKPESERLIEAHNAYVKALREQSFLV